MRIALIQLGYDDDESMPERVERVSTLVREVADEHQPDLVVLPELWGPTGFDYRRWEGLAEPLDGPWVSAMTALAAVAGVTLHAGSFIERLPEDGSDGRNRANTSVLVTA